MNADPHRVAGATQSARSGQRTLVGLLLDSGLLRRHGANWRIMLAAILARVGAVCWVAGAPVTSDMPPDGGYGVMQIEGEIGSEFPLAKELGMEVRPHTITFQFQTTGKQWTARWRSSQLPLTDYMEAFGDGVVYYEVRSHEAFAEDYLQRTGTNIVVRCRATVDLREVPRSFGMDSITVLWYVFASREYLSAIDHARRETPWVDISSALLRSPTPAPLGREAALLPAVWEIHDNPPYYLRGIRFYYSEDSRAEPNSLARVAGEITVMQEQILAEGISFPQEVHYLRYDGGGGVLERQVLTVRSVTRLPHADLERPSLPGVADISDFRFARDLPTLQRVAYITNRWLDAGEVFAMERFASALRTERVIGSTRSRFPVIVLVVMVALLAPLPLAALLRRWPRDAGAQTQTPVDRSHL